jgi:hypothetical protein
MKEPSNADITIDVKKKMLKNGRILITVEVDCINGATADNAYKALSDVVACKLVPALCTTLPKKELK